MIEINNLVKRYGDIKAVNGISFTVNDGEVLGFLGPNGAGKSTTMNIITGYLSSTSGTVKVNGHDILEDSILSMVKIVDMADRLIGNLSKGYKQRVGIAQALVGNPDILILDEPTVGLDPNQILEIRKLIRKLADKHTVILSSHILSEIQAVCDRVVIINQGKVAAIDTITDLSSKLSGSTKLSLSFKGPVKEVTNKLRSIPGVNNVTSIVSNDDTSIHQVEITADSSAKNDVRTGVFYAMSKGGWPMLEFRSMDPSLEEIFLSITSV